MFAMLAFGAGCRRVFGFVCRHGRDGKAAQDEVRHMVAHADNAFALIAATAIVTAIIATRFATAVVGFTARF